MTDDNKRLFSYLPLPEPPDDLLAKIKSRLLKEQRLRLQRKLVIFTITMTVSAIALIPAFKFVQQELVASGFIQFLSLAFSDFTIVSIYWKNFLMSLLESMPAISLSLFLTVILLFLGSLKLWLKNFRLFLNIKTTNQFNYGS